MSLTKRRITRRAMGVVVGASLLVLGLEAPAWAAAPVVSAFTPDSGPAAGGCVLVVTGTALDDFATATWEFIPTTGTATPVAAKDYVLISDTEAWVETPALTSGTAYTLKVTNAGGTSTSTGTFLATAGAGNCAPTITAITPDCGGPNTKVVITGTNLLDDPDATEATPDNDIAGATVQFRPYATNAAVVPPDSDTATQLTRFVSSDALDGPIKVIAGGGTVFSTASFEVPPPDCPLGGEQHERSISLSLRKHLVARGAVTVEDDTTECIAGVPVKIQRRKAGAWKNVGTTTTTDTGTYKRRIKDKPGKYRAVAPAVTLEDASVCTKAVSPRVRHTH